jgi:hypothetical protein
MSETGEEGLKRAKYLAGRTKDGIARRLGIDRRALAVFRVGLGVVVIFDLLMRSFDFTAFYTDEGVLPSSYLASDPLSSLSVHFLSGDAFFQAFLFVVTAFFAFLLLIGYRTRFVTLGSFVLVTSLQEYNPYVLNAGDTMLRWYLFFGIFLPLGARWSVDSLRGGTPETERVEGIAAGSALVYAVMIYTVNGTSKMVSDAWTSGEAVANVMNTDKYTVLLGNHIGGFEELLVVFNWAWLVLLVASVFLVVLTWWLRFFFAGAFIAAHTSMLLTMQLGIFPLIAVAVLMLFLPSVFWDRFEPLMRRFEVSERRAECLRSLLWADAEPLSPERVRYSVSTVAPVFVGVVLLTSVMWQVEYAGYDGVPDDLETVADPAKESWTLFAPTPPSSDDWFLAPATLESGETVDLLHLTDEELDRPPDAGGSYPNTRWRKYLTHSTFEDDRERVERLAAYLCERGTTRYESHPVNVTVYDVRQPDPREDPERTYEDELVRRNCDA